MTNHRLTKLIEDSLPTILAAAVISFMTMTYQVVQMRADVDNLKNNVSKIESSIAAMMARTTYYRGDDEAREVARLAALIEQSKNPGVALLPSAQAQEK